VIKMGRSRIERFPEGLLEHISKTISDYMTGTEISELITVAGYPEKSIVIGTKWKFLYAIFKEFNARTDGQYHISKIVQYFCDPTRWIGKGLIHKEAMNKLNEGLAYVKLQLNENGKLVVTDRRIIHIREVEEYEIPSQPKFMTVAPVFRERDIEPDESLCFILIPFKPSFERLYRDKIKPTIDSCGFKCLKADDLFSPTPILEDIWVHICKSKIIIADVTGRNPNVFYEIGIAHTVGKPVIIITQDPADIPFDIAHFRYFVYSDDADGWNILCSNITSALKSI